MRILGIDPGIVGGIAVIETCTPFDCPALIAAADIPIAGTGPKRRLNAVWLLNWIRRWKPERAFIERAQAMPDQGASSGFLYGRVTGALEAVVVLSGIPLVVIEPAVWKRALDLPGAKAAGSVGAAKEVARQKALQVFGATALLASKAHHGRAEACLMALYGAESYDRPTEEAEQCRSVALFR